MRKTFVSLVFPWILMDFGSFFMSKSFKNLCFLVFEQNPLIFMLTLKSFRRFSVRILCRIEGFRPSEDFLKAFKLYPGARPGLFLGEMIAPYDF